MFKKLRVTSVAILACAGSLALGVGAAAASGSAPTTATATAASVTAVSANIEGTITPNGSTITAASFCYGTSPTLSGCTTASLSSSVYSGLSTSSTADPVYASISGLSPSTTYYYSLSATNNNGSSSSSTPYGSFTTQAAGPFTCTPAFYQVSSTGSGALYSYNVSSNSFTRIGSGAVSSINGVGYDTADNYLYGVSGTTLYQINNDGQFTSLGAVTGLTEDTGADFYDGQLLEAGSSGTTFESVDVSTKAVTNMTLTNHVVGSVPGAASWGASDLTIQGNYAYGMSTSTSGTTLYVADLANHYLGSIPVTGIPNASSGTYAYGAAYSDPDGNAYFYNNTTNIMYEVPSSALQAAISSGTDPAGSAIGSGASSPALSGPNDGATCPNAASPYAPSVNPPTTGTVGTTTAAVNGVVSADDSALTDVAFCYSTGSDTAADGGALTDSPTCVDLDQSTYPYTTWSGTNLYNISASLNGLSGCTTYYYQSEAVNSDGTAYSTVADFTTSGCQTVSFGSTAPTSAAVGGDYTPSGSATSGLTPVITVDASSSSVCSISGGLVSFNAAGSCVLDINQAGNGSYAAAPQVQQTFTVSSASATDQTVSFSSTAPTSAVVGDTYTPSGSATSGLTPVITVDSGSSSICSISAGLVSFNAAGSCVLDINQSGNGSYNAAAQVQQTITVGAAPATATTTVSTPTATTTVSTPTATTPVSTPVSRPKTTTTVTRPPADSSTVKVAAPVITSVTPGNGEALVAWTAPAHSSARVTHYVVTSASGKVECRSTTTTCLVTGLTNGSSYKFTVTAMTADHTASAPSHPQTVQTSAAPVAPANGSHATDGAAREVSSTGSVSHVAVRKSGSAVDIGGSSFGLSLGLSRQSVNYSRSSVSMFSGSTAQISGYGFLRGSTVTLYISSSHIKLGTARVGRDGRFDGRFKIPASLKSGYHTLISTGITAGRKRENVEGSVRVTSKTLLVVVPFGFNESTLTPLLLSEVKHDAETIAFGGVTNATISAYTDPRGSSSYNIALSQRRAQAVAAQLRTDLAALNAARVKVVVLANGKADPVVSGGHVVDAASRRVVITI